MPEIDKTIRDKILFSQKNELTEHYIYKELSTLVKEKYRKILIRIADEELKHYEFFKTLTEEETMPDRFKIFFYVLISRIFGLNFGLKLMEKGEDIAQKVYEGIKEIAPEIENIIKDENRHENELISLIQEERLKYVSSVVLGLNDALVEISGALVGFSLALQKSQIVGIVGLITGIAGALSMGASSYLSAKEEDSDKIPLKAGLYTGLAYICTIVLLVFPYFLLKNIIVCLGFTIITVFLLIFIFNYYVSVARELRFRNRFFEMIGISLGVAMINFFIGLVMRKVFGIEI
ncbi:MAG: VIT1/CCC1 transporter family protein [candidate division WOR-3 bacterium]|nr:VIT1/CCC1 transporter family protein [candidate division WOR-3 bacterium]